MHTKKRRKASKRKKDDAMESHGMQADENSGVRML
jgi:hypothetical protein